MTDIVLDVICGLQISEHETKLEILIGHSNVLKYVSRNF